MVGGTLGLPEREQKFGGTQVGETEILHVSHGHETIYLALERKTDIIDLNQPASQKPSEQGH
jgi:hypothetical protein